jgi:hypothetical protein
MATVDCGAAMVGEMVEDIRRKYGNRPALLKALAKV